MNKNKTSKSISYENDNIIYYIGDKVIQTRNNYDLDWCMKTDKLQIGKAVLNGEVGFVESIDKINKIITIIFDDEKLVDYNSNDIRDLELAYAITVHKSQGGEFQSCFYTTPLPIRK